MARHQTIRRSIPMTNGKPTAGVKFRLRYPQAGFETETLWAYDLGKDRYRLANLPFWLYGVSVYDIVLAPYNKQSGFPSFKRVIIKSGNRTVRVCFSQRVNDGNESDRILNGLINLGCGFENADGFYFAINVPPATRLYLVAEYLEKTGVWWELADPVRETAGEYRVATAVPQ